MANLKKISINVEYKGKPVSSSQNKERTLKIFLTRAETALWFSNFFGLNIKSILIKECDSGVKTHFIHEAKFSLSFGRTKRAKNLPKVQFPL